MINKIIDIYQKLNSTVDYTIINNKNWVDNACIVVNNMNLRNLDKELLIKFVYFSIDVLNYNQQLSLFNSIEKNKLKEPIYNYIVEYFKEEMKI